MRDLKLSLKKIFGHILHCESKSSSNKTKFKKESFYVCPRSLPTDIVEMTRKMNTTMLWPKIENVENLETI